MIIISGPFHPLSFTTKSLESASLQVCFMPWRAHAGGGCSPPVSRFTLPESKIPLVLHIFAPASGKRGGSHEQDVLGQSRSSLLRGPPLCALDAVQGHGARSCVGPVPGWGGVCASAIASGPVASSLGEAQAQGPAGAAPFIPEDPQILLCMDSPAPVPCSAALGFPRCCPSWRTMQPGSGVGTIALAQLKA